MKQVAQNYRSGELTVLDVPVPACRPGGVLVRSLTSLISTGTELMKVGEARLSLLGKARARPDQVRRLLDTARQQGPVATYQKAMGKLDSYTPLGYSLAGTVVEVGAGAEQFAVGQLVAAAGNEHALHAEYNWVPVNLCVPVPDGVPPEHAAFATVGAIAMQGIRRAEPALGETACVIGLGLIGQLAVRLLLASGLAVVGIDTVPARCREAEKAGALLGAGPGEEGLAAVEAALLSRTGGLGADHVILAAGGTSNGPVEAAARLARDRARIVDIGKTRLDLPWNAYYDKELDVRFSRSYGPGRYDAQYELQGVDYPPGYVRWTERRNLGCFLDLLAGGSVDVAPLIAGTFPITEAPSVYTKLDSGELPGVGFLFTYPAPDPDGTPERARTLRTPPPATAGASPGPRPPRGPVRLGFIGAGSYATSTLLPPLADDPRADLVSVVTATALSGMNARRAFGFTTVSTDPEAVLDDDTLDAVVIVTRHHTHARFVSQALERGHAVFVEKPLALTAAELDQILETVARTGNDRLMVGFNRRFAPLVARVRTGIGPRRGPLTARYLVAAGQLSRGSWYLDESLEGSRFTGEGGHFIDTLSALVGDDPLEVSAAGTPDDLHVTLRYPDGSTGTVAYVTTGSPRYPKETLDVHADGRSALLDNFRQVTVWAGRGRSVKRSLTGPDKGQRAQLSRFLDAVRTGGPLPIPLHSLVMTTRATLAASQSLATRSPVAL
jgi:predicted dehydrogenase/threonine dehydrogenase-like Zn-dependent dehydrogenase